MESQGKPTVRVVAAVIEREGKYLITQRMPHAVMPLLWEFPGGKVEPGETDAVALARELAEEMAIAARVRDELMAVVQEYDEYIIDFHVYLCDMLSDTIQLVGINDCKWVTSDELDRYPFPAADQATVRALIEDKPN